MTNKEREILEIIKENPTIEQSEIARLLDISRSTVAVHISSLQRQGYLLGKGYIVNDEKYIVGIGACNVDIYGTSNIKIKTHFDHPASIHSGIGGVMYNLICNYSKLGGKAKLITAYSDDSFGRNIIDKLNEMNIDYSDALFVKGKSSSIFMQVQDENNDMYLALCDMSIIQDITPEFIISKQNIITNATAIILDPSLNIETIETIIVICKDNVDIYVDPISDNYALKIKPYLKDFCFIKPNLSELEMLTDQKIRSDEQLVNTCRRLLDTGLKKIMVSRGKDGILYMDNDLSMFRKLKVDRNPVNMSGAGDALMAAYIYGVMNELSIEDALDYALAAGIAAIRSENTINENMSVDLLENILKEKRNVR